MTLDRDDLIRGLRRVVTMLRWRDELARIRIIGGARVRPDTWVGGRSVAVSGSARARRTSSPPQRFTHSVLHRFLRPLHIYVRI